MFSFTQVKYIEDCYLTFILSGVSMENESLSSKAQSKIEFTALSMMIDNKKYRVLKVFPCVAALWMRISDMSLESPGLI